MRPNVLLVTLDQFRGDSLSCAGHCESDALPYIPRTM